MNFADAPRRADSGVWGPASTAGAVATAGLAILAAPAAHAAQVVLTEVDVNTDATRATGHNDFLADGVHVYGPRASHLDGQGRRLLRRPRPARRRRRADAGLGRHQPAVPALQLTTDFDGDGDVDGILVGEPVYGGNWWVGSVQDQTVFDAPNTPPTTGGGGGALQRHA